MNKKVLVVILFLTAVFAAGLVFLFSLDCPEYQFDDVEICIGTKTTEESIDGANVLTAIDSLSRNGDYYFIFDPLFKSDIEETIFTHSYFCIGSEDLVSDEIRDVSLSLVADQRYALETFGLPANQNFMLRDEYLSVGEDFNSFKEFYNDLATGQGDFYTSIFSMCTMGIKINKKPLKGPAKIEFTVTLKSGRKVIKTKEVYLL